MRGNLLGEDFPLGYIGGGISSPGFFMGAVEGRIIGTIRYALRENKNASDLLAETMVAIQTTTPDHQQKGHTPQCPQSGIAGYGRGHSWWLCSRVCSCVACQ